MFIINTTNRNAGTILQLVYQTIYKNKETAIL